MDCEKLNTMVPQASRARGRSLTFSAVRMIAPLSLPFSFSRELGRKEIEYGIHDSRNYRAVVTDIDYAQSIYDNPNVVEKDRRSHTYFVCDGEIVDSTAPEAASEASNGDRRLVYRLGQFLENL